MKKYDAEYMELIKEWDKVRLAIMASLIKLNKDYILVPEDISEAGYREYEELVITGEYDRIMADAKERGARRYDRWNNDSSNICDNVGCSLHDISTN